MDGIQRVQHAVCNAPQVFLIPWRGCCVWQAHWLQRDGVPVTTQTWAAHSMHQPLGTRSGLVKGDQVFKVHACPVFVQGPRLDALLHRNLVRAEVPAVDMVHK